MLPDIDIDGQEKLLSAQVLIIGLGGLGCSATQYLAASGVGRLTLCDDDIVELSNLQRQILHHTQDVGKAKVISAAQSIADINPEVVVRTIAHRLEDKEMHCLIDAMDLVVDGTDNFAARYKINAACIKTKTPAVYGAAIRLEGQIMIYDPRVNSACYACLHGDLENETPELVDCAGSGVASPLVGIIGASQAMEALKLLAGISPSSAGFLQSFDAKTMQWQKFRLPKQPSCRACSLDTCA